MPDEEIDARIDDSEITDPARAGSPEDAEGSASTEGEGAGPKTGRRDLSIAIPLPRGISPAILGLSLVALFSAAISILATVKTLSYKKRYDSVLQAARDPANLSYYKEKNARLRTDRLYQPETLTIVYGSDLGHQWNEMLRVLRDMRVINRSIARQNLQQMALRLEQDVLNLKPKRMVLLPPTRGAEQPLRLLVHARVLCATAQAFGVQPIVAALPPIPAALDTLPGGYCGKILTVNRGLQELALTMKVPFLDLFSPLAGGDHYLRREFCSPNLLPNPTGYRIMTDVLEELLRFPEGAIPTVLAAAPAEGDSSAGSADSTAVGVGNRVAEP